MDALNSFLLDNSIYQKCNKNWKNEPKSEILKPFNKVMPSTNAVREFARDGTDSYVIVVALRILSMSDFEITRIERPNNRWPYLFIILDSNWVLRALLPLRPPPPRKNSSKLCSLSIFDKIGLGVE